MFEEAKKGRANLVTNNQAYMQMDRNYEVGYYPQISLLDELHEKQPNSTFIMNFRPIMDWIRSTTMYNGMRYRFAQFDVPGLVLTNEQRTRLDQFREFQRRSRNSSNTSTTKAPQVINLSNSQIARWWCGHVRHIRKYVKHYTSHKLIELDLYDTKGTSKFLYDLFQADADAYAAGTAGTTTYDVTDKKMSNNTAVALKQKSCWGHANTGK